jgi:hypothetical protein
MFHVVFRKVRVQFNLDFLLQEQKEASAPPTKCVYFSCITKSIERCRF